MGEIPLPVVGILQARVLQQELAVDAGIYGDRKLALQALLADEFINSVETAEAMLDELFSAHAGSLPQFI
jgi:alpha-galactosidase/6-phospho-beta-glucosidase family protein